MDSSLPSPDATPLLSPPSPGGPDLSSLMASFFNPSLPVLIVTIVVIFLTPLLIHTFVFRSRAATTLPTFLLVGPAGSGKTSLMTAFESETESGNPPPDTRTSQTPLSLECSVSAAIAGSSKYRSVNDPSMKSHIRFLLSDTPGHGKLRHLALSQISSPVVRGVIYVLDSSMTDVRGTAEYLYDVLMALQKAASASGVSFSQPKRLLIACNKSDVFTALPASKIQRILEDEITSMRISRSKGILDVEDDGEGNEEKEWLGEGGEGPFEFKAMEEVNVEVEVKSGSVEQKDWKDKLSIFIGGCL